MYDRKQCIAMISDMNKSELLDLVAHLQKEGGVTDEALDHFFRKKFRKANGQAEQKQPTDSAKAK